MPKQNSALLLNKYIWLIDTIYSAGHISRGANVEVVFPKTLRDQIKAEIAEMHKLYK